MWQQSFRLSQITAIQNCEERNALIYWLIISHVLYTTDDLSQIETQNWQICQIGQYCQCCVICENLKWTSNISTMQNNSWFPHWFWCDFDQLILVLFIFGSFTSLERSQGATDILIMHWQVSAVHHLRLLQPLLAFSIKNDGQDGHVQIAWEISMIY